MYKHGYLPGIYKVHTRYLLCMDVATYLVYMTCITGTHDVCIGYLPSMYRILTCSIHGTYQVLSVYTDNVPGHFDFRYVGTSWYWAVLLGLF